MIAFTDPAVHPASAPFYRMFPWEPLPQGKEVKIERVVEMRRMTLESLLERIPQEVARGKDFMIIYHGTEIGLSLPITRQQQQVKADSRVLGFLLDSDLSISELAGRLIVSETKAARLRQLSDAVRALGPQCVLLRACNTGKRPAILSVNKEFFGAGRLGAPDVRDAYAQLRPGRPNSSTSYRERWLNRNPQHHVYEVPLNGWLALATSGIAPGRTGFRLNALTDSRQSVGFWMDVYLSRLHSAHTFRGRSVPIHAIVDATASFPLVFPGEDNYTSHLVTV